MARIAWLIQLSSLLVLPAAASVQTSQREVKPGQVMQFEFQGLPATVYALQSGAAGPPTMTVRLPDNYNARDTFPVFVYLQEANGGPATDIDKARAIIGTSDFVLVSMPLFKRQVDKTERFNGILLSAEDLPTLAGAYKTMLGKLYETVPNTDPIGSVIGGFSNGGNALAVLLAGHDPTITAHFRRFFFVEGGIGYGLWLALYHSSFKNSDLLVLLGTEGPPWRRKIAQAEADAISDVAQQCGIPCKRVVMEGTGHAFPDKYYGDVKSWAQAPLARPSR